MYDELRGDLSEAELEGALKSGEGLRLADILAQAEQEAP